MVPAAAAAQLGALAALLVIFIPMAMAGYHLSRNKMLFFSGALFISLAVFVHLTPYFPLPFHFLPPSTSSSPPLPPLPLSCLASLHTSLHFHPDPPTSFSFSPTPTSCHFRPLSPSSASDLLNGSLILIAGDSQSRLFALSLLTLLLRPSDLPPAESALFRRHSDYQISIPDSSIDLRFLWSPFESNLTSLLRTGPSPPPDVLVAGSGLWHMLHVNDPAHYSRQLSAVRAAADLLLPPPPPPHLFWLGLPDLVEPMLNTEEKRERMNRTVSRRYEREGRRMGRSSGGPFFYLDVGMMTRRCGEGCTADGMHYDRAVYDAAVQVMLNALLIESRQRV